MTLKIGPRQEKPAPRSSPSKAPETPDNAPKALEKSGFDEKPVRAGTFAQPTLPLLDVQLGNVKLRPSDVVMIGDSQLESAKPFLLKKEPGLAVHSHWGKPISHFRELLREDNGTDEALALKKDLQARSVLTIHLGGNDLSDGKPAREIISDMKALISSARKINPGLRMAVADIPWRFHALENPPEWLKKKMEATSTDPLERQKQLEQVNNWVAALGDDELRFSRIPINRWVGDKDRKLSEQTEHTPTAVDLQRSDRNNVVRKRFRKPEPDVHLNDAGYRAATRAILKRLFEDPEKFPKITRG